MAWSLLLLPILLAQGKPEAVVDKAAPAVVAPAVVAPTEKPVAGAPEVKVATKGAAGKAAPVVPPAPDSSIGMFVYIAPIILLFYFMILRPQRKNESKLRDLLSNLKKGDKVLTSGGMFGTVMSADPASDKVVVRVDDDKGVKITFSKSSIVRVIDPQPDKASESLS
jgi:preprotein translocase subunit YajC